MCNTVWYSLPRVLHLSPFPPPLCHCPPIQKHKPLIPVTNHGFSQSVYWFGTSALPVRAPCLQAASAPHTDWGTGGQVPAPCEERSGLSGPTWLPQYSTRFLKIPVGSIQSREARWQGEAGLPSPSDCSDGKCNFYPRQVCFTHDCNCEGISLPLSQPMSFYIIISPVCWEQSSNFLHWKNTRIGR